MLLSANRVIRVIPSRAARTLTRPAYCLPLTPFPLPALRQSCSERAGEVCSGYPTDIPLSGRTGRTRLAQALPAPTDTCDCCNSPCIRQQQFLPRYTPYRLRASRRCDPSCDCESFPVEHYPSSCPGGTWTGGASYHQARFHRELRAVLSQLLGERALFHANYKDVTVHGRQFRPDVSDPFPFCVPLAQ